MRPFQCSSRDLDRLLSMYPTAQALRPDRAVTPSSMASAGPGLGTCRHEVPFQRKMRDLRPTVPTAQAFRVEVADTEYSWSPQAGGGLGTRFHPVPFQCKISVFPPPKSRSSRRPRRSSRIGQPRRPGR